LAQSKKKEENRLPPNQKSIQKILRWGIEHPGLKSKLPHILKEEFILTVDGEVEKPLKMSWERLHSLPQKIDFSDFHCVEGWSVLSQKWEGILFRDLMEAAKMKESARYAWFECADGYTTSLPIEELMGDHVLLAHKINDEELPQPLGGPLRLVVPHKYAYKSPMWVTKISLITKNRLGYWESGYYSDSADPEKNDRYRK
jgi:DMSO/TMAO reductase YedYZ molybdopterin-dependent catalytic subunit